MVSRQHYVAVGLLSESDLRRLGSSYRAAIPVQQAPAFEDLLLAIDEAQRRAASSR